VRFEYPGYDTSLFWDDDGKAYMVGSFYWRVSSVRLVGGIRTLICSMSTDTTRDIAV
jgi:beta-xylosidase